MSEKTYSVFVLDYIDDNVRAVYALAARRGPKMDNGPARGLALNEAQELCETLTRIDAPAFVAEDE